MYYYIINNVMYWNLSWRKGSCINNQY